MAESKRRRNSARTDRTDLSRKGPVAAVDLGGTKVLTGVVDREGNVRSRVKVTSIELKGQPEALLDRVADTVRAAATAAGLGLADLAALGMGVPGPLDPTRSVVDVAPNLGWGQLDVHAALAARLPDLPIFLENDVRSGALAEFRLGAGRGLRSLIAVFVGSGVGGGIVLDGSLYHGSRGGAGEIGHLVIDVDGPRCPCGRAGCLEAVAARGAVARYVKEAVEQGQTTALSVLVEGDLLSLTSGDIAAAIEVHDDAVARDAVRRGARYVGLAIGGLVNVLDPDVVVLGGGLVEALAQNYLTWASEAARTQILADRARDLPIVLAKLGDDAGLLGAALTAFDGLATAENAGSPPREQSAPALKRRA